MCEEKFLKSVHSYTEDEFVTDSYQKFLRDFHIDKQVFLEWGISNTIFPPKTEVESEWNALKARIFNNQTVYIRGYGRDAHGTQLYIDLYKQLFNNYHVKRDPINNLYPIKSIQKLTGLKRNINVYNYQVSHIWGHTKNIFLFEAPWNICYTPKIFDPLTGHEAKGVLPIEYQKIFIGEMYKKYKDYIDDYNRILVDYDVEKHLKEYLLSLEGKISEKELLRFSKDATNELSKIEWSAY